VNRVSVTAALVVILTLAPLSPVNAGNGEPTRVRPGDGRVALTFDDGPHPYWTPRILDALDRHGVRATFFVVGASVVTHPELVAEMARRGHSVQNHTWSHPSLVDLSDDGINRQLSRTDEAIWRLTGVTPSCMRPPYMYVNRRVRDVAAAAGTATVLWDRDPQEWRWRSVTRTIDYLISGTGSGDIILLHDTHGAVVLPTLDAVIPALRGQGLEFDVICAPSASGPFEPRRFVGGNELR
jgi:peptidoglycan-N-acetylglucosamine deacetylase